MKRRRIAVVTTSRADYGLLSWLIKRLDQDARFALKVIACGSHLSRLLGRTASEIEADGIDIAAKVDLTPRSDSPAGVADAIGRGARGFARAYDSLRPDLVVVLGDRFELLAAVPAAVAMRLPIAHIHGGESTEGVLDEQVRHAVSKMSHLHFPAAETYRRRLIAMGENPRFIWCFGAPGLESIRNLKPESKQTIENRIGLQIDSSSILVTYHPDGTGTRGIKALFEALDRLGLKAIFTASNADAGGEALNRAARAHCGRRPGRRAYVQSLGRDGYLNLARVCGAVAGNSSSGIIEIPSLGIPTVNIGDRQKGRLRSPSIVDCRPSLEAVVRAIRLSLSPAFKTRCRGGNAYGDGRFSANALRVLASVPLGEKLLESKSVRGLDERRPS